MNFSVYSSLKGGTVDVPKSKCEAVAFFAAAALANSMTRTEDFLLGNDAKTMLSCIGELGAIVERKNGFLEISPYVSELPPMLNCKNSTYALCYSMAISAALGKTGRFTAEEFLRKKKLMPFFKLLCQHGFLISSPIFPIYSGQRLHSGKYEADRNVLTPGVCALLTVLPLLDGDSSLEVECLDTEMLSVVALLENFSIEIRRHGNTFYINGNQKYVSPGVCKLNGDNAMTAAWLCMGAVSRSGIVLHGCNKNASDTVLKYITAFGASVVSGDSSITVECKKTFAFDANCVEVAPYLPFLVVLAAIGKGTSRFVGVDKLSFSRLHALKETVVMLARLGASLELTSNELIVHGMPLLRRGAVTSFNEPDIAVAAVIAAQASVRKVLINGAEAASEGYPSFYKDFRRLGGELYVHI